MKITTELVLSWNPCAEYTPERIRALCGDGLTPPQVAELDIPARDRFWVLIRCLCPRDQRLLAASCAERALMRAGVTDARSWAAVRVARLYALGEGGEMELAAARAAAYAAARAARATSWAASVAAAWDASNAAAYDAAWDAAYDAAWDAAWAASVAAAWDASNAAAYDAAWDEAIQDVLRLIEGSVV